MPLPNPDMDAVPFTPLTAEFLDDMIENIESLSDGSGLEPESVESDNINLKTLPGVLYHRQLSTSTSQGTSSVKVPYNALSGIHSFTTTKDNQYVRITTRLQPYIDFSNDNGDSNIYIETDVSGSYEEVYRYSPKGLAGDGSWGLRRHALGQMSEIVKVPVAGTYHVQLTFSGTGYRAMALSRSLTIETVNVVDEDNFN